MVAAGGWRAGALAGWVEIVRGGEDGTVSLSLRFGWELLRVFQTGLLNCSQMCTLSSADSSVGEAAAFNELLSEGLIVNITYPKSYQAVI